MLRRRTLSIGFLLSAAVWAKTPDLHAQEPETKTSVAVSLLGGWGTTGDANLVGFGGGVRAGATFEVPFYAGALVLGHWGTTDPGEPDVRHRAQDLGVETGYAFRFAPAILRPTLRGGVSRITTPRDADGAFWSPHVGLGATAVVEIESAHVGLDADTRIYTRTVDNGDNRYSVQAMAAYLVAGVQY